MKWMFGRCLIITVLLVTQVAYAASSTGRFFNVTSQGLILNIAPSVYMNRAYSNVGIKINTSSHTIDSSASDCRMQSNGYCLFSVAANGTKQMTLQGANGPVSATICLNGIAALTCQTYSLNINQLAYISNYNSKTISSCPVKADGTLEACSVMSTTGSPISEPYQVALNAEKTRAYVVSRNESKVFQCLLDSQGDFIDCQDSGNTGADFDGPSGIVLNQANTIAYVTNQGNLLDSDVSVCPILSTGSFGDCVVSGNTGVSFDAANGIGLNVDETFAYIANAGNNTVSVCPIQGNGTFGACLDSGNSGVAFVEPVAILTASSTTIYVSNYGSDQVLRCPVTPSTGLLGACVDSGNTGVSFFGPGGGVIFNNTETSMYVASEDGFYISLCPLNTNGSLGACAIVSQGVIDTPIWMTLG